MRSSTRTSSERPSAATGPGWQTRINDTLRRAADDRFASLRKLRDHVLHCLCSGNSRRKTMPASQGLAVPQHRAKQLGENQGTESGVGDFIPVESACRNSGNERRDASVACANFFGLLEPTITGGLEPKIFGSTVHWRKVGDVANRHKASNAHYIVEIIGAP